MNETYFADVIKRAKFLNMQKKVLIYLFLQKLKNLQHIKRFFCVSINFLLRYLFFWSPMLLSTWYGPLFIWHLIGIFLSRGIIELHFCDLFSRNSFDGCLCNDTTLFWSPLFGIATLWVFFWWEISSETMLINCYLTTWIF